MLINLSCSNLLNKSLLPNCIINVDLRKFTAKVEVEKAAFQAEVRGRDGRVNISLRRPRTPQEEEINGATINRLFEVNKARSIITNHELEY